MVFLSYDSALFVVLMAGSIEIVSSMLGLLGGSFGIKLNAFSLG